jgi:acetolactate synthase-1/2/3 large subunit
MTRETLVQLTGGQMIVEYLISEGVKYVFAVPGHGNTALVDAFVDYQDQITVLPAMHEQGAAHMADGYYRATGEIAVALTSIGPGATNALTGLTTAYADSIPILLITGGAHTYLEGRGLLQEIDRPHGNNFPAMAAPVVKRWWQPGRLEQFPTMLHQAFNTMLEGRRGPVLLDIAQDLQAEMGEWHPPAPRRHRAERRASGNSEAVAEAAALLASAKRPLVLAGGGTVQSGGSEALVAVAEYLGAPVTNTFNGKGAIPEDHELSAGPCGDVGSFAGNQLSREADVILAVGCRFSDRITSSYRPGVTFNIPDTKLVQVDIDGFEIGKNYPVEVGIVGDAKAVLEDLLKELQAAGPPRDYRGTEYFAELQRLREEWEEHLRPWRETDHRPMTLSRALVEARKVLPRHGIVVTDSSSPLSQTFNEFPVYGPKTHVTDGCMQGIGFGVPAALGVQLGAPQTPVMAIIGDGSFLMTGTEIATAVMLGLPTVFLVFNNGGWGAIANLQEELYGDGRELNTHFRKRSGERYYANVAAVAEGLGCHAERVEDPAEIGAALERAFAVDGPAVVEAMTVSELPWSAIHATGEWDITVPAYLGQARDRYVSGRGF